MAATERDNGVTSDAEASEKPVREQLKKASISMAAGVDANMGTEETVEGEQDSQENGDTEDSSESRGRLQKKRSFDDFESEQQESQKSESSQRHSRKRSRDSTVEENELNNGQRKSGERVRDDANGEIHTSSNGQPTAPASDRPQTPEQPGAKRGEAAVEEMTSPKSKRSRLHPSTGENGLGAAEKVETKDPVEEREMSEPADEDKQATKIPPTSGFANTSASSPFTSLASPKSPPQEPLRTSTSAFNASGFSTFSASTSTGFGAIGKSSGGFGAGGGFGFSSTTTKTVEKENKPSGGVFGGSLGQKTTFGPTGTSGSAFSPRPAGFGSTLGQAGGFGGAGFESLGGGSGLTSFASGKASTSLASASKIVKGFGAPAEEEDEGEDQGDDDASFKSPLSQDSDKQDERFYEQELETGEEDETTDFSGRAKLYNFVAGADGKKEWKERGLGVVRLNVRNAADEEDAKPTARLLMRAEGSHRVILNTPIKKEIKFGSPSGGPPDGNYILFMGTVDGKTTLEMLQLKMRQPIALELYEKVAELQGVM